MIFRIVWRISLINQTLVDLKIEQIQNSTSNFEVVWGIYGLKGLIWGKLQTKYHNNYNNCIYTFYHLKVCATRSEDTIFKLNKLINIHRLGYHNAIAFWYLNCKTSSETLFQSQKYIWNLLKWFRRYRAVILHFALSKYEN